MVPIPYPAMWPIGLNERDLPEVPLGLLQGPIPENYPLKPTSRGSDFEDLAGLGPGEVPKLAQLARSGPGGPHNLASGCAKKGMVSSAN